MVVQRHASSHLGQLPFVQPSDVDGGSLAAARKLPARPEPRRGARIYSRRQQLEVNNHARLPCFMGRRKIAGMIKISVR